MADGSDRVIDDQESASYIIDWSDIRIGVIVLCCMATTIANALCIAWYLTSPNRGVISCTAKGLVVDNVAVYTNERVTERQLMYRLRAVCGGADT